MRKNEMTSLKRQVRAVKGPESAWDLARAMFRDANPRLARKLWDQVSHADRP